MIAKGKELSHSSLSSPAHKFQATILIKRPSNSSLYFHDYREKFLHIIEGKDFLQIKNKPNEKAINTPIFSIISKCACINFESCKFSLRDDEASNHNHFYFILWTFHVVEI